jgi:hypothetical protein
VLALGGSVLATPSYVANDWSSVTGNFGGQAGGVLAYCGTLIGVVVGTNVYGNGRPNVKAVC